MKGAQGLDKAVFGFPSDMDGGIVVRLCVFVVGTRDVYIKTAYIFYDYSS